MHRAAVLASHLPPPPGGGPAAAPPPRRAAHPTLGAELHVDLHDPASCTPEAGRRLRAALVERGVLCIRTGDSPLSHDAFRRVCELIAPVKRFIGKAEGGEEVRYGQDMQTIDAGKVHADGKRRGSWKYHTDDSYTTVPGRFTCLHPLRLPPSGGGDTGFIDMRTAWRQLPEADKAAAAARVAVHHYNNGGLFTNIVGNADPGRMHPGNRLVDAHHPLVRVVPETGERALYLNLNRMKGVAGLGRPDSIALLRRLEAHAERVAPEYRHQWRHGDVLCWDNALVAHRVHEDWPLGEPRRMIRFMVGEERVVGVGGDADRRRG